jgi:hypothetical protein
VFYESVRLAPGLGARRVHVGIKASEGKALRGASLRPLWLVDLTENSPLGGAEELIRRHNRKLFEHYAEDARTSAALVDPHSWREFC